jgi:hypothetical protein
MYAIGKYIYSIGLGPGETRTLFFSVCRWVSAFLGATSALLVYQCVRQLHRSTLAGVTAFLLAASSPLLAVNAHYAHNDIYQVFFSCIALTFLVRYLWLGQLRWFYAGVFAIGLAASSKYTGGILLIGAWLAYALMERRWKQLLGGLVLSSLVCYLGYALGTPLALLNPPYYFSNLLPALGFQRSFGQLGETSIGLFGQWGVLLQAFNPAALALFGVLLLAAILLSLRSWRQSRQDAMARIRLFLILSILLLDLPIAQSFNYQERFFLPMLPFLAVLSALVLEEVINWVKQDHWQAAAAVLVVTGGVILLSAAYVVSITLLFKYEPRIAAGNFLRSSIVEGKSLEFTLYPPVIPEAYFKSAVAYPLFFKKAADWEITQDSDQGAAGIEIRKPDYLVVDSFTYLRYDIPDVCQTTPNDCAFFHNLLNNKTNYQLVKTFHYDIPRFLPQAETDFLNPTIKLYQRVK